MHLYTIIAFALIFWRADQRDDWTLIDRNDVATTLLIVLVQPALIALGGWLAARRSIRMLSEQPGNPQVAQQAHHRSTFVLRTVAVATFGATLFFTPWPALLMPTSPALQILGDLAVLAPFLACIVLLWLVSFPLERRLRSTTQRWLPDDAGDESHPWRVSAYLGFNLRNQLLVVAVPMTLILFAANMTRGYGVELVKWSGRVWMPDLLLGASSLGVFVLAPLLLCRIWRTTPLEDGPMRRRLVALADRVGLRFREILVWHSDGMMINAAVMGVFAPVRYVLLSDALLETMDDDQVEAVFGHEAGHVRLRHIQHFLVFALVGWMFVGGLMESLARMSAKGDGWLVLSPLAIQSAGLVATIAFWGIGFGWLSRRFERQADLFGARCVTPGGDGCPEPCSVHLDAETTRTNEGRVCVTGASIFASALDRVAVLNGIPHEERSWRHSSIGSRIRFLTSLAGDPNRTASFERLVNRAKLTMLILAAVGVAVSGYYLAKVG